MNQTPPKIEAVAEKLVANGAVYVAATEPSLADDSAQLVYHTPAGTPDDQKETIHEYLDEMVGHQPYEGQIGAMEVDGEPIPTCVDHVLHSGLHLYRRVPVYIGESIPGLDEVSIEEGIERVEEMLRGEAEPTPHQPETVSLEQLLDDLATVGAASVEVALEPLVFGVEPGLRLRIPVVAGDAAPIVKPVESVTVDGNSYPLRSDLTLNGPYGDGRGWMALYVGDNVRGLDPRSIEDGLEIARELLAQAEEAKSPRELKREIDDST